MTDKLSAREELYLVAQHYQEADIQEKAAKKEKETWRGPLFELMTEIVRDEIPLAKKTIEVPMEQDPREYCAQRYPDWVVVSIEVPDSNVKLIYQVTIEENPDLKKFEFVHDGFKFGRTVDTGSPVFDAEGLYNNHPDLRDLIDVEVMTTYSIKESKAQAAMAEHPELKDVFQAYIKVPVPKPKLLPIRPIKEDEE